MPKLALILLLHHNFQLAPFHQPAFGMVLFYMGPMWEAVQNLRLSYPAKNGNRYKGLNFPFA